MDTNGAGVADQGTGTGESAGTNEAGGSAGEQADSQGSQEQETNAGGEQSFSESGKEQGTDTRRPQFRSKNQTIYELRQAVRERDAKLSQFEERLSTFEQKFQPRGQERKTSRTFYEAPEDTLREIQDEKFKTFKDELLSELRQTQDERESAIALKQEASEAAKFIRGQKGITDDDIQEIRDILQTDPGAQRLADLPMAQAKYVMQLYGESRGVSDKTDIKNKARGVTGAAVNAGAGSPKTWTETEMEAKMKELGDPNTWGDEQKKKYKALESEFMRAYQEKRVKK